MHDDAVPATSFLGSLRSRREEIINSQRVDFRVPRWENPTLWLRFKPVEWDRIRSMANKIDKMPDKRKGQAELEGNLDLLAVSCVGMLAEIDGRFYEVDGPDHWAEVDPKAELSSPFNDDVAATVGAADRSARSILRAMFVSDGDIVMMSGQLARWSGFGQEVDEEELGNSSTAGDGAQ